MIGLNRQIDAGPVARGMTGRVRRRGLVALVLQLTAFLALCGGGAGAQGLLPQKFGVWHLVLDAHVDGEAVRVERRFACGQRAVGKEGSVGIIEGPIGRAFGMTLKSGGALVVRTPNTCNFDVIRAIEAGTFIPHLSILDRAVEPQEIQTVVERAYFDQPKARIRIDHLEIAWDQSGTGPDPGDTYANFPYGVVRDGPHPFGTGSAQIFRIIPPEIVPLFRKTESLGQVDGVDMSTYSSAMFEGMTLGYAIQLGTGLPDYSKTQYWMGEPLPENDGKIPTAIPLRIVDGIYIAVPDQAGSVIASRYGHILDNMVKPLTARINGVTLLYRTGVGFTMKSIGLFFASTTIF